VQSRSEAAWSGNLNSYVIGDVQGCCDQLDQLYAQIIQRSPQARFFFAGDIVNRGPRSLSSLRFIKQLGARGDTVLGNHDLNLLAVAAGIRTPHRNDTLDDILRAPDKEELIHWLRHRPLALMIGDHLLVHAGVYPQWTVTRTLELAQEVEQILQGDHWQDFLRDMYGNSPSQWHEALHGPERWRCIVNGLTRMRFCTADGEMDFSSKDGIDIPTGYHRWFDVPDRRTAQDKIVFGHWSTLGLILRPDLISLDTGCVWGGQLTAVCLNDRQIVQISCPQQQTPGAHN
jgi:bis(5'-nucleosyl)-tetraphosphatase (symmetrical)